MADNIFDNSPDVSLMGDALEQGDTAGTEVPQDGTEVEVNTPGAAAPEGTETEGTTSEWGKEFATPEEMYKAYQGTKKSYDHLRPKFTQTAQELSTLRKAQQYPTPNGNNSEGYSQMQNTAPQEGQAVDARKIIADYVNELVAPVRQQNDDLNMQMQVSKLMTDNPDFADLAPTIMELFKDDPALWNTKNPIEKAYKLAKVSKLGTDMGKMATDAREAAYADKDIKVLSNNKANPANNQAPKRTDEEAIQDSILAAFGKGNHIF